MLMITADTYLNIILNMNQKLMCYLPAFQQGKTSPAVRAVFTHQTSPTDLSAQVSSFFFCFPPISLSSLAELITGQIHDD